MYIISCNLQGMYMFQKVDTNDSKQAYRCRWCNLVTSRTTADIVLAYLSITRINPEPFSLLYHSPTYTCLTTYNAIFPELFTCIMHKYMVRCTMLCFVWFFTHSVPTMNLIQLDHHHQILPILNHYYCLLHNTLASKYLSLI